MKKSLMIMAALVFILTACLPGQTTDQTQAQINTAVAGAIATQQNLIGQSVSLTLTSVSQNMLPTSAGPTAESLPTNTPLSFPTLTPVVPINTLPPVHLPSSGGGGAPVKRDYACQVINRKPKDNAEYYKGAKFDIKWTIVNTGTKAWYNGYDVKYFSGTKMSTTTFFEIPTVMNPNDTYEMNLDGVAPNKAGTYVMTWTVQGQICYPYVKIAVVK